MDGRAVSAVDEIQAAIDKLTKLRDESTPGPWDLWHGDITQAFSMAVQVGPHEHERIGVVPGDSVRHEDAALIVTLHATIDAQLAILTDWHDRYAGKVAKDYVPVSPSNVNPLALARAINGTS